MTAQGRLAALSLLLTASAAFAADPSPSSSARLVQMALDYQNASATANDPAKSAQDRLQAKAQMGTLLTNMSQIVAKDHNPNGRITAEDQTAALNTASIMVSLPDGGAGKYDPQTGRLTRISGAGGGVAPVKVQSTFNPNDLTPQPLPNISDPSSIAAPTSAGGKNQTAAPGSGATPAGGAANQMNWGAFANAGGSVGSGATAGSNTDTGGDGATADSGGGSGGDSGGGSSGAQTDSGGTGSSPATDVSGAVGVANAVGALDGIVNNALQGGSGQAAMPAAGGGDPSQGGTLVKNITPQTIDSLNHLATQKLADAERQAGRLEDSASGRAYTDIARGYGALNDPKDALRNLDTAIGKDPGNVQALDYRSALRDSMGDRAGAVADAKRAVAIDPADELGRIVLGHDIRGDMPAGYGDDQFGEGPGSAAGAALGGSDGLPALVAGARTAAQAAGGGAPSALQAALGALGANDMRAALAHLSRYLTEDAKNVAAWVLHAHIANTPVNHLYETAILDADKALALDPKNASAFFEKGYAQMHLGRLEDALKSLAQGLALNPKSGMGHYFLALALEKDGRDAEALAEYKLAASYDPRIKAVADKAQARLAGPVQASAGGLVPWQWIPAVLFLLVVVAVFLLRGRGQSGSPSS